MISFAQDISIYQQFNGRYGFTFIGNTLNVMENNIQAELDILTESSATLTLNPDDTVVAAYLYWAGSGTGDFEVNLNDQEIIATRDFAFTQNTFNNIFEHFSAFADITTYIQTQGNGVYTFSGLDNQEGLEANFLVRTNYAGWAIIIIYENLSFPLNQLNVYDGLQGVPQNLSIVLDNLNVIDNIGSQIGFLAWEGDSTLAVTESLKLNGSVISNLPLNPPNNAFNSTNSFTGQTDLFNMDLDVYPVQNYINIGDTSALIELTSGQDFVLINAVVSQFNSQLPDATVAIDNIISDCDSQDITIDYTVYNTNSLDVLPAGTVIQFVVNGSVIGSTTTSQDLEIDESESGTITLTIPLNLGIDLEIVAVVDPENAVFELNEDNNTFTDNYTLKSSPETVNVTDLTLCGFCDTSFTFDLTQNVNLLQENGLPFVFYANADDAENQINPLTIENSFTTENLNTTLYIRIDNEFCYTIFPLSLDVIVCEPDASIEILYYNFVCSSRVIDVFFEVFNIDCVADFPAQTPYAFYIDGVLIDTGVTTEITQSGASILANQTITIPEIFGNNFILTLVINDDGTGNSVAIEADYTNNSDTSNLILYENPDPVVLPTIETCRNCLSVFEFDISSAISILENNGLPYYIYESENDAENETNPIPTTSIYTTENTESTLYIRIENSFCFIIEPLQLNTILCEPDATIEALEYNFICSSRDITVFYEIFNADCGQDFPAETPIAFYIDDSLIGTSTTQNIILSNGSITALTALTIPENFGNFFTLTIAINDDGTGSNIVSELNYDNNSTTIEINLYENPIPIILPDLTSCNIGDLKAVFDFLDHVALLEAENYTNFSFHETYAEADLNENAINYSATFEAPTTPFQMFVRIENDFCYSVFDFNLFSRRCPPIIYNYVSANNNGYNDVFYIEGLLDIFTDFNLTIFNQWGHKIWTGKNSDGFWDGTAKFGTLNLGNKVPDGTYFYVLELNDEAYPEPLSGYLYINR